MSSFFFGRRCWPNQFSFNGGPKTNIDLSGADSIQDITGRITGTAQINLAMNATVPTAPTLWQYSTNCAARTGRRITRAAPS